MTRRLLYKPEEAADALAVSRTRIYELIRGGQLESVKSGRNRRIPAEALDEYVARLRDEAGAA